MKKHGSIVKLSRHLGIALTPKAAKVMSKRDYPPGQHGASSGFKRSKMSDYKIQLLEKQKLRAQYNIHERQLANYYATATGKVGNSVDNLIQLLESRLDSLVLRAGIAPTIYAARQYVSHGHITVNGKRVNIASFQVNLGDVVGIHSGSQTLGIFEDAFERNMPPSYIALDRGNKTLKLVYLPKREEVTALQCEVSRVIEFYSR
jgi:small subunit ribosomal protein S4